MPIIVMGAAPSVLGAGPVAPAEPAAPAAEEALSVCEVVALSGGEVAAEEPQEETGKRKRARQRGRFRGDDPATPADEAWEG